MLKKATRKGTKPVIKPPVCSCGACKEVSRGEGHTDSKEDLLPNERPIYDECVGIWEQLAAGTEVALLLSPLEGAFERGFLAAMLVSLPEYEGVYIDWEETAFTILKQSAKEAASVYAQGWIEYITASSLTERGDWSDKRLRDIAVTEGTTAYSLFQALSATLSAEARKSKKG